MKDFTIRFMVSLCVYSTLNAAQISDTKKPISSKKNPAMNADGKKENCQLTIENNANDKMVQCLGMKLNRSNNEAKQESFPSFKEECLVPAMEIARYIADYYSRCIDAADCLRYLSEHEYDMQNSCRRTLEQGKGSAMAPACRSYLSAEFKSMKKKCLPNRLRK